MIKKFDKKLRTWFIGGMALIITISFAGCGSKVSTNEDNIKKEVAVQETSKDSNDTSSTLQDTSKETTSENEKTVNELKSDNKESSFNEYINLLGLSKEKLIGTLNEKPSPIDEGGLEFKEAGVRVWFDAKSHTLVDQIFIMKSDMDLNGVKIGDKISKFKEVFGKSVSDKNGDAHFKYKDIFLSVNYDTKTEQTYGVYLLQTDF